MAVDHQQQRYRVIERLASGGMAEVFVAESAGIEGFKKTVAIKRVLPHLSEKKRFIAMFLDEARLSAHLSHSNVVQVFDIGVGDNTYFIVMEYVDGADLKQVIKHVRDEQRAFPIEAALYICAKMCEGLAYAHELENQESGECFNVVHRDISPPNVLISKFGEIKIVDFGLAKASTQLEKSEAGIIKGKFSYLSPEAAHGHEVDARADIFAVGIMLWEMLAGRRLFQGKTDYDTVKQVQSAEIPPITKVCREADDHLESILRRALARDRDARYGSARALGSDLTRYLYKVGKPVGAFDIAELVRGPMQSRKLKVGTEGVSIIDKLIAETLFEFTSLQDKDEQPVTKSGDKPFSFGNFEDFSRPDASGKGEGDEAARLLRTTLTAQVFEPGNLAALEGPDDDRLASNQSDDLRESLADEIDDLVAISGPGSVRLSAGSPSSRSIPVSASPVAAKSSAALKAVLLFVIAAGAAAAVWFSGLL
jgi:eukaryotic-like serine/threonine-protein kinase